MDFKALKKALAAEAKAAGICEEWYNYILNAPTKDRLLALYFGGFDFVQEHSFPSEPLRREFDDIRRRFNVYEGEAFRVTNARRLVAYTEAEGSAIYNGFAVAQLWARRGSKINVHASGDSYVTVDVAEGAEVNITATENARLIVYLHGGVLNHRAEGMATIKLKNK